MTLNKLFLVGLISACLILNAVQADDCVNGTITNSLSLCEEFQLLEDLVPHSSIITLIQNHMANDIRFRRAVQYLQSSDFKTTAAKIDATATFKSFLRPFTRAGVDTSDINGVYKIFDCLIIPNIQEAIGTRSSFNWENIAESRSLDSFVQEVIQLIPVNDFVKTLKAQLKENTQFAKFYKIVREPSFRSRVMQGFVSILKF